MKLDLLTMIAASERLDRIVAERRASFECIDFAKRRAAAKLGIERRAG